MKAIAVALLSFSVGGGVCYFLNREYEHVTQVETYEVYIDPAFGSKKGEVQSALNAWQAATKDTDHPLIFTTIDTWRMCGRGAFACDQGVFTIHPQTEKSISLMYGKPAIGLTDPRNNVFVAKELTLAKSRRVLMHEVGHILSLRHNDDDNQASIMRSDIAYMSDGITEADIEQYKAVKE